MLLKEQHETLTTRNYTANLTHEYEKIMEKVPKIANAW